MLLDAVVAVMLVSVIFVSLLGFHYSQMTQTSVTAFKGLHYLSEDVLDTLNKQGILDEIGEAWAENDLNRSQEIADYYLEELVPESTGYRLSIDDEVVAENPGRIPMGDATTLTHASRMLVGYGKGLPVRGSVARAFLSGVEAKETSSYAYFGGFVGEGNITRTLTDIPADANLTEIYLELSVGSDFYLFINGNQCGGIYTKASNTFSVGQYTLDPSCHADINPGDNNTFEIVFNTDDLSLMYIGGGYVRVTYDTTELAAPGTPGIMRYYFPGIAGLINLYDSFYVPGDIYQMDMHLHIQSNHSTFMRIGNRQVNFTTDGTEQEIDIADAEFEHYVDYKAAGDIYSEQTVPLRLGTEGLSYFYEGGEGIADIIVVTDESGSMDDRMDSSSTGVERSCSDPSLDDPSTQRMSVAKCVDNEFIDIVMNISGNRIGLVGYDYNAYDVLPIGTDVTAMKAEVDDYEPGGWTCTPCAIQKAIDMLTNTSSDTLVSRGSCWRYSLDYLASAPPANWTNASFDDSGWESGKAPLGYWNAAIDLATRVHALPADLWPVAACCSATVDFACGLNTTDNTFSLGGSSDDGWDWWRNYVGDATGDHCRHGDPSGASDFDTDWGIGIARYDGPSNRKFLAVVAGDSDNWPDDVSDSCAWGIEVNITDAMWTAISGGASATLSFDWMADDADDDFEEGAWIKATFGEEPGDNWLGSDLDSGHDWSDATPEIWGQFDFNGPGWNGLVTGSFSQDVSAYITGPGTYYLSFGAKVDWRGPHSNGKGSNEGVAGYFDNIELAIGGVNADLWDMAEDQPAPIDFSSGVNATANTNSVFTVDYDDHDDGWDWFRGELAYGTGRRGYTGGDWDMTRHYDPDGRSDGTPADGSDRIQIEIGGGSSDLLDSGAWGVQINITQDLVNELAAGAQAVVSFDYEAFDRDTTSGSTEEACWIKSRFFKFGDADLSDNYLGYDLDSGNGNSYASEDATNEILYDRDPNPSNGDDWHTDNQFGDFDLDGDGDYNAGTFQQNVTATILAGGAGWYYLDVGAKFDATPNDHQGDDEGIVAYFNNIALEVLPASPGTGTYLFRKTFNVNTSGLNNTYLYVASDDAADVYLNGVRIDNDSADHVASYWNRDKIPIDTAHFIDGENVLAVSLANDDTTATAFDLELVSLEERLKALVLMSDGCANYCNPPPIDGYAHGLPYYNCDDADAQAEGVSLAQEAVDNYSISIYTVLFGDACATNMQDIACTDNCSHFYQSDNASELAQIYRDIANEIVNASYRGQAINVTEGNISVSTLYEDSYIEFMYTPTIHAPDYGEISINLETPTFGGCTGVLNVRENLTVTDVKVTSYSGEYWTDYLALNNSAGNNTAYSLRDSHFGSDYTQLGDPFFVQVPSTWIENAENNTFTLGTGNNPGSPRLCSAFSRAIYTVRLRGGVDYGGVFQDKEGCNWNIEFEDGSDTRINFPANYNGTDECNYTLVCHTPACFDTDDAVDDAVYRLLSQLDIDDDGRLGLEFAAGQLIIDFSRTGEVRSLWGPIKVDLTLWQ